MNSPSSTSIPSSYKTIVFLVALVSFLPSMQYLVALNVALIFFFFKDVGLKYAFLYLSIAALSMVSFLFQSDFYWKGLLLSFLTFSSLIYPFLSAKLAPRMELILLFCRTHIVLSVLQVPLQIFQFIKVYGFNFFLFTSYSSAGDVAFGTIAHSAELAYKQILSLVFLFYFREHFSKPIFILFSLLLAFSFLLLGANHALVALVATAFIFVSTSMFSRIGLGGVVKRISVFAAGFALLLVLVQVFFTSQLEYTFITYDKLTSGIEELGKPKAFLAAIEVFGENPALLITGLGLGSFASRAAFILSGEYLWQGEHALLGTQVGAHFNDYMFPLWNNEITSVAYLSGTINQPFSSVLAVFSECGLIVFLLFGLYVFSVLRRVYSVRVVYFLSLFVSLMLLIDNYLEYPRFIGPALFFIFFFAQKEAKDPKSVETKLEERLEPAGVSSK